MEKQNKENLYIFICIFFIILVAVLGSIFVNLGMNWFLQLQTPSQWISNIVIPIVWTVIYILFAIIISILIKNNLFNKKILIMGLINGFLNVAWCLVFFAFNQTFFGILFIVLNGFFATYFLIVLQKTNKWYVNILWIYPIWIYTATCLNIALWVLN